MAACKELGWGFIGIGDRLEGECAVWISDYSNADFQELIGRALAACHSDWVRA